MQHNISINARNLGQIMLDNFCPRCFWFINRFPLSNNHPFRSPMPGIVSTLDAQIKRVIDASFSKEKKLPLWLLEALGNLEIQDKWKSTTWQVVIDDIQLTGQPDALWKLADESYLIADYKVAQWTESQERIFPLYEAQLKAYAYLAEHNGLRVGGLALIYFEPITHKEEPEKALETSLEQFTLKFSCKAKFIKGWSAEEVEDMARRVAGILRQPNPPEGRESCKGCQALKEWFENLQSHMRL